MEEKKAEIKAMNKQELANHYNVSGDTMKKWIVLLVKNHPELKVDGIIFAA